MHDTSRSVVVSSVTAEDWEFKPRGAWDFKDPDLEGLRAGDSESKRCGKDVQRFPGIGLFRVKSHLDGEKELTGCHLIHPLSNGRAIWDVIGMTLLAYDL